MAKTDIETRTASRTKSAAATKRLLLISSSTVHGTGYLEHVAPQIRDFLGPPCRVAFVPYAIKDLDAYEAKVQAAFTTMGLELSSVHRAEDPAAAIRGAQAVFVGGGNTFRLLARMHALRLLGPIRSAVESGTPYLGSSAGSNAACPTIMTTNDMPIVQPPTFEALGLVPFQINPHYVDPDPASKHMGETREQRLREYHEENDLDVIGLREGAWLRVEGSRITLGGSTGAKLFRKAQPPLELNVGTVSGPNS
jgi:dipeptidase E